MRMFSCFKTEGVEQDLEKEKYISIVEESQSKVKAYEQQVKDLTAALDKERKEKETVLTKYTEEEARWKKVALGLNKKEKEDLIKEHDKEIRELKVVHTKLCTNFSNEINKKEIQLLDLTNALESLKKEHEASLIKHKSEIVEMKTCLSQIESEIQKEYKTNESEDVKNQKLEEMQSALVFVKKEKEALITSRDKKIKEMNQVFYETTKREHEQFIKKFNTLKEEIQLNIRLEYADSPEKYMKKLIEKNSVLKLEAAKLEWQVRSSEKKRIASENTLKSPLNSPVKALFSNEASRTS